MAKINLQETVIVSLTDGEIIVGTLIQYPDDAHPYWYVTMYEDTSIVGIPDRMISSITRPSNSYMKTFITKMQESLQSVQGQPPQGQAS